MAWSKKGKMTHLWVTHVTDKGLVHHCLTWRKTWRKVICFQHKLEIPCHVQCDDPSVESSIKKCVRHLQIKQFVCFLFRNAEQWMTHYIRSRSSTQWCPNDVGVRLPKTQSKDVQLPKAHGGKTNSECEILISAYELPYSSANFGEIANRFLKFPLPLPSD